MDFKELENERIYSELEDQWVRVFLDLLKDEDQEDWMIPYYNTFFSNGKKMMDMNPIFFSEIKIQPKVHQDHS